jgi:hypothetical protein
MKKFLKILPVILVGLVSGSYFLYQKEAKALPVMTVYKTPTCGCCQKWVDHVKANGIKVEVIEKNNLSSIKDGKHIPGDLRSCHTAFIGRYTIEGHVPAKDILKLLKEKIDIQGLAVGGMPVGSPGMEYKNRKDPYDVVAFKKEGKRHVYSSYHK